MKLSLELLETLDPDQCQCQLDPDQCQKKHQRQ